MENIEQINNNILNIGDTAPNFSANSTIGKINLSDYTGKWIILFSHPGDFTPVCSTEILAFTEMYNEFTKRNCVLLDISLDSISSHLAWINDLYKISKLEIPFPIISDTNLNISKKYNMVSKNNNIIRKVYIICPEQKIQCILSYPITIGRNIVELLRILDALQISKKNKVLTPANWIPGLPTLNFQPYTQKSMKEILNTPSDSCFSFYLCYNQNNIKN